MKSRELLPHLALSRRLRKTPYEDRVMEHGPGAFTVYNQMPLASYFESSEADYRHLCEHVQIWDVSVERQIEVVGKDALKLVELSTPRDISRVEVGQCVYAPLVDEFGGIVNDPVITRLAQDRFWVSIADSGVLLWLKGIAWGRNLDVSVFEADVSPMAIQGPKSDDLMASVLGDHVRDIRFFWFIETEIAGTDVILARSGWSGQGGFEIYLQDSSKGLELWDLLWEAGKEFNIRAGCPNLIDRIERGLLSFGSDMTMENNPFECGLDRFFELGKDAECISTEALARIRREGVKKNLVNLSVDGDPVQSPRHTWDVLDLSGNVVGIVTSLAWSPDKQTNLAFATVNAEVNQTGSELRVNVRGEEIRTARIMSRNWK